MEAYLLKSTICLAVLLSVYLIALEGEKMHKYNRVYLMLGLVLSLVVTFIPNGQIIEQIVESNTQVVTESSHINTMPIVYNTEPNHSFSWNNLMMIFYIIGLIYMVIRFVRNISQLLITAIQNRKSTYRGAQLIFLKQQILPHSFLNYIYVNGDQYLNGEIDEKLLAHEMAHVKQKHSWDIIFIELIHMIFWFNPILIYYKRVMQLNHEFLADAAVNEEYHEVSIYQHLLVDTCQNNNQIYLASNINFQLTKKRLNMMNKKSSRKKIYLLMAGVMPLVIALVIMLGQPLVAQSTVKEGSWKDVSENIDDISQPKDTNGNKESLMRSDEDELAEYKFMRGLGIKIPRSFSPNGDGNNDILKPFGQVEGVTQFEFIVFNKYGEIVFQSNDVTAHWNGTKGNQQGLPEGGIYVYSLNYTDADGLEWKKNGEIKLIIDPNQVIPVLDEYELKRIKISEYDTIPKPTTAKSLGVSKSEYYKNAIVHFKYEAGKTLVKSYNALPNDIKEKMPMPPSFATTPAVNKQTNKPQALEKGTIIYLKENGSIVIGNDAENSNILNPPSPPSAPNVPSAPPSPPKSPNVNGIAPPPPPPAVPSPLELIDKNDSDISYWMNGQSISRDELDAIETETIESINVKKNNDGTHNVTVITKSNGQQSNFSFTPNDKNIIAKEKEVGLMMSNSDVEYILDGKKVDKQTIDDLKSSLIESIEVINIGQGKKQISVKSKR